MEFIFTYLLTIKLLIYALCSLNLHLMAIIFELTERYVQSLILRTHSRAHSVHVMTSKAHFFPLLWKESRIRGARTTQILTTN
jgi:hypothetical protein